MKQTEAEGSEGQHMDEKGKEPSSDVRLQRHHASRPTQ